MDNGTPGSSATDPGSTAEQYSPEGPTFQEAPQLISDLHLSDEDAPQTASEALQKLKHRLQQRLQASLAKLSSPVKAQASTKHAQPLIRCDLIFSLRVLLSCAVVGTSQFDANAI
jgi:hypothetical protein